MSRGRKKQTLRDFTRQPPSKEDKEYFDKAMNAPSDIVCALLQAIKIEHILEECLIVRLARRDDATIDLLNKDNGAFGTYFSKIGLAYALGVYDEDMMEYLNTVRRNRNAFAHARRRISFASAPIRHELHSLRLPKNTKARALTDHIKLIKKLTDASMPETVQGDDDMDNSHGLTGRAAYTILCMNIIGALLQDQAKYYDYMKSLGESLEPRKGLFQNGGQ